MITIIHLVSSRDAWINHSAAAISLSVYQTSIWPLQEYVVGRCAPPQPPRTLFSFTLLEAVVIQLVCIPQEPTHGDSSGHPCLQRGTSRGR